MPFTSRYDTLRNEEEFEKFTEIFAKVLKRRGIERKKYQVFIRGLLSPNTTNPNYAFVQKEKTDPLPVPKN